MKQIETRSNGSIRVRSINDQPSLTQQQFKEQCDINNIIAKYKKTGEVMHLNRKRGMYADLTKIQDYHSALQSVIDAQSAFATLPSDLRTHFKNDPGLLLQFLSDPKNYDEGVKIGLIEPKTSGAPAIKNEQTQTNENEAAPTKK